MEHTHIQRTQNAPDPYTIEELISQPVEDLDKLVSIRLEQTPVYTVASFLHRLNVEERRVVLRKYSFEDASLILAEMDAEDSAEVVAAMREWRALKILEEFEPDDAADLVYQLKESDQERLLDKLSPQMAREVRGLLKYPPETAGGIMTPYFTYVHEGMKIEEALHHIRKLSEEVEHTSYVYAIDTAGVLKGVLSIRSLILAKPDQKISNIMQHEIEGVCTPYEDREKIALKMANLNHHALPVVDNRGRIIGIIEHDDIIDIIQSEATEDFQKIVGAGADESIHDPIFFSIKRRLPWLLVNLGTAAIAAWVVSLFQGEIEQLSLLAVFIPLMASLGGNTGAQTLAVAIRSIALGDIETSDNSTICTKEALKGLLNGIFIGLVGGIIALLMMRELSFAFVIFSSMAITMFVAGTVGAFIPLMLRAMRLDPAQSSSIFLTAINDSCSSLIFLSIGSWLLL